MENHASIFNMNFENKTIIGPFAINRPFMALPPYARLDEIASFVAYLAGPEASFIAGAGLLVDGGHTA
jgi:3-oxoacyl-[acyl-carrier protein] reductase